MTTNEIPNALTIEATVRVTVPCHDGDDFDCGDDCTRINAELARLDHDGADGSHIRETAHATSDDRFVYCTSATGDDGLYHADALESALEGIDGMPEGCEHCGGSGEAPVTEEQCGGCEGTGTDPTAADRAWDRIISEVGDAFNAASIG
jgi:hypothetical protein